MATHIVARAEDIPHGGRKIVRLEGREVGIFNLDGTFYALKNVCPHQGARVCLGRIVGTTLPSDVYEFKYGLEGRILRCPWHEWEYDITTGRSVFDANVRVVTYAVEVVDGEIAVTIGGERAVTSD
ncbi:MAG TPA: Rieske (2Fe-2S) protein [Thermomicrobiales bacterium]|jgi:nitrite reductase/ring-hydroxylating ferredoxin subunit